MIRIWPVITVPGLYTPYYNIAEAAQWWKGRANETLPKIRFNPSKLRVLTERLDSDYPVDCGCGWGAYCSGRDANDPQTRIDKNCVHNYKWLQRKWEERRLAQLRVDSEDDGIYIDR